MENGAEMKQKKAILAGCKYYLQVMINLYPSGCLISHVTVSFMVYLGICPASIPDVDTASGSSSSYQSRIMGI